MFNSGLIYIVLLIQKMIGIRLCSLKWLEFLLYQLIRPTVAPMLFVFFESKHIFLFIKAKCFI